MGALPASSPSAAGGRCSEGVECAAVYKIEEKRKPEDFIGYRKRGQIPIGDPRKACFVGKRRCQDAGGISCLQEI